jgi:hypothetical protein
MVAARQVQHDAERQADAARLQLRLQQNQANAERKLTEDQERSKLRLHARRIDVLRRKEQARCAATRRFEAESEQGSDWVQEATEINATHRFGTDAEAQRREISEDLTVPTTVGLEERPDGSFRLLITPASLPPSPRHRPGATRAAPNIPSCFKA